MNLPDGLKRSKYSLCHRPCKGPANKLANLSRAQKILKLGTYKEGINNIIFEQKEALKKAVAN